MTPALLPRRLANVLGMLGSDHDGECLAAARQAERIRRDAGVTWQEIIAPPPATRPRQDDTPPTNWRCRVAWCLRRPDLLTEWERCTFLPSLAAYKAISPRQAEILDGIARKCGGSA